MVNARHLFYGISMLEKYKDTGKKKPFLAFMLTDETYSLVCSSKLSKDVDKNWYYLFVSVLDQSYWVIGSAIGGLLGALIIFNSNGIDFAMTALFVVIFTDQWISSNNHLPAMIGVAITLICLLIFGQSSFLIPSMIGITLTLTLFCKSLLGEVASHD